MSSRPNRAKPLQILRLAGRLGLVLIVLCVLGVIAMQFEGIVAKNVAMARELSLSRNEIEALRERKARQQHTIKRLADPAGAVPEIHDKLRLVGPREEIIYLRGAAQPSTEPDSYGNE